MNIGFKKRWIKLIVQIVFFIVLSIVFVYPFQKNGIIYFGDDMKYHVNRILELINNLKMEIYILIFIRIPLIKLDIL